MKSPYSLLGALVLLLFINFSFADDYEKFPLIQQDDEIIVKPTSPEAYCYLLATRPEAPGHSPQYGMIFEALKLSIYRIRKMEEAAGQSRDFIVLAASYTPVSQLEELNKMGVFIIRVATINVARMSEIIWYIDQFTKFHVWKLTAWKRILYIDIDIFPENEFIMIWDDPATQIQTKPAEISRDLRDYPKEDLDKLYPYLLAATRDVCCRQSDPARHGHPDLYFNAGLFMIMPSLSHYAYLMKMKDADGIDRKYMEQEVMNQIYFHRGPIPWTEFDSRYNIFSHVERRRDGVRAFHSKLWTQGSVALGKEWQDSYSEYKAWEKEYIAPDFGDVLAYHIRKEGEARVQPVEKPKVSNSTTPAQPEVIKPEVKEDNPTTPRQPEVKEDNPTTPRQPEVNKPQDNAGNKDNTSPAVQNPNTGSTTAKPEDKSPGNKGTSTPTDVTNPEKGKDDSAFLPGKDDKGKIGGGNKVFVDSKPKPKTGFDITWILGACASIIALLLLWKILGALRKLFSTDQEINAGFEEMADHSTRRDDYSHEVDQYEGEHSDNSDQDGSDQDKSDSI